MNEKDRQGLYEKLSAYLDGESDAPGEVERLIQTDADAARLYDEISRVSTHVKSLRTPDVHPAFATRVMAHVREVESAGNARPVWRRHIGKILGAVAACVFIAIAVWPFGQGEGITIPPQNDPVVADVLRLRNQPDQVLAEKFGPLLSEIENAGAWTGATDSEGSLALVADPAFSENYADVVGKVATLLGADTAYDEETDVFTEIDSLNESQSAVLRVLLTAYSEKESELL